MGGDSGCLAKGLGLSDLTFMEPRRVVVKESEGVDPNPSFPSSLFIF